MSRFWSFYQRKGGILFFQNTDMIVFTGKLDFFREKFFFLQNLCRQWCFVLFFFKEKFQEPLMEKRPVRDVLLAIVAKTMCSSNLNDPKSINDASL